MARARRQRATETNIFVDRVTPRRIFKDAVSNIPASGCALQCFYGPGGQGKTALAREFFRSLKAGADNKDLRTRPALVELHGRPKSDPDQLLVWIRNEFAKTGMSFAAFDLAFAIMWERTRGAEPLPVFENPWLTRSSDTAGEAAKDVVQVTREMLEKSVETIPGLGVLISKGSRWLIDKSKRSYLARTRDHLAELYRDGELRPDYELPALMPWMLAQDFNYHLDNHPDDRFVLIMDEMEGLLEAGGTGAEFRENRFDEYLQEFCSETDGLLAVFLSRERLHWESSSNWADELDGRQYNLEGLEPDDARDWLIQVGVTDAYIQHAMMAGARETDADDAAIYPLMLQLQILHWRDLGAAATPADFQVSADGFSGRRRELLNRLLRDYDDGLQRVLKRLCLLERFDRTMFEFALGKFGISLSAGQFDDLAELSLVTLGSDGWLSVHRAVNDTLKASLDADYLTDTRAALAEQLKSRANPENLAGRTAEIMICFELGSKLQSDLPLRDYIEWLYEASDGLLRSVKPAFLLDVWTPLLDRAAAEFGKDDAATLKCHNMMALNLEQQGRIDEAEKHYRIFLDGMIALHGEHNEQSASAMNNLAHILGTKGEFNAALNLYSQAHDIMAAIKPDNDMGVCRIANNIAQTLGSLRRFEEATETFQDVEKRLVAAGLENTSEHGNLLSNLSTSLYTQGKIEEAAALARRAVEIRSRTLGEDHPETAISMALLAEDLAALGQVDEAETLARQSLKIRKTVFGKTHSDYLHGLETLARVFRAKEDLPAAEAALDEALTTSRIVSGATSPQTARALSNLAYFKRDTDAPDEAAQLFGQALEIYQASFGDRDLSTTRIRYDIGICHAMQGEWIKAGSYVVTALKQFAETLGKDHSFTKSAAETLHFINQQIS